MQLDLRQSSDSLDQLSDAERRRLAATGWVPAGAWTARMDLDPAVLEQAPPEDHELLRRLASGNLSEVWVSSDGSALLEVERFRHDLCWQLSSLLSDGTLVRTAVHSARDEAGPARLSSCAAAGYDRETLVDRPLEELERRHRERLRDLSAARRSEPYPLRGEDHPRLVRRIGEITDHVASSTAHPLVLVVLVGPPLLAAVPIPLAWALGAGLGPAMVAAAALLVFWMWTMSVGAWPLATRLHERVAPWVSGERIPARRLLGR